MVGTPTSTRTPPSRRFENYVLTRVVDQSAGLTNVTDNRFTPCSPALGGYQDPGVGFSGDAVGGPFQIGFDFLFDGITYKQFVVVNHGWMVLVDPTTGTFAANEVISSGIWQNPFIKPTFTSKAVLLAPWFDDSRNIASTPDQLGLYYSTQKVNNLKYGIEPMDPHVNGTAFGVRYFQDVRSTKGRRLIVRWSVITNYYNILDASSVISYEVVIYENGTIEFRYTPRTSIRQTNSTFEGATIGIFMPNGTNRFRDFAQGLGYLDGSRQEYIYGGFTYNASFMDVLGPGNEEANASASYVIGLRPQFNWPGLTSAGSVFTFSPPVNRRQVLPRSSVRKLGSRLSLPLVARTGDDRLGVSLGGFDDRRSPQYTTTFAVSGSGSSKAGGIITNYPTTLPRFFGGTAPGTFERQNLFSNDMLVTGSVVKSAIDAYVGELPPTSMPAFNEDRRYEQDQATLTSSFYATGSSLATFAANFDQQLKSKTQVRVQFPVNTQVVMPGLTSSIYYYNAQTKCWEVPFNSSYVLGLTASVPSPGSTGGDWTNPIQFSGGGLGIIEDSKGFGPVGNIISSGTITHNLQSDPNIGLTWDPTLSAQVLGTSYANSVRNCDRYAATPAETFTLPINAPFLIEKAVFEIPLAMGAGWFADITQCFSVLDQVGSSFDFGGPGITVALFRQVQLSENSSTPALRDLILTGTLTHSNDMINNVVLSNFPAFDSNFQLRPVGFVHYAGSSPGAVVPVGGNTFTGSVAVTAQALSAVGPTLEFSRFFNGTGAQNKVGALNLLQTPTLVLGSPGSVTVQQETIYAYISPFGRAGTGFDQSGRSVLGNEYVTLQGLTDQTGLTVPNPFYISGTIPAQITAALNNNISVIDSYAAISMVTHFPSPYLVMPGDKLILSISKTRPVLYSDGNIAAPLFSGTFGATGHDVTLRAGTINVTLYGSQIQAGAEYHDTLNQPLASDDIHELLGAEPVLDQFESAYRAEYTGSFTDNVMVGNLLTLTTPATQGSGSAAFIQGNRTRMLSIINSQNVSTLTTSSTDLALNTSKAYRTQPWWEQFGSVRLSQFTDNTERFYDSMMPKIDDCFAADATGIFISPTSIFGNPQQVEFASGAIGPTNIGWIWFDQLSGDKASLFSNIINCNWTKAYPFEPRYLGVSRQLDFYTGIVSNLYLPAPVINTVIIFGIPFQIIVPQPASPSAPAALVGFFFGPGTIGTALTNVTGTISKLSGTVINQWVADVNLLSTNSFGYYTTGSVPSADAARALFGFGDNNTCNLYTNLDASVSLLGTNHFAEFRDQAGPHPDGTHVQTDNNTYLYSPKIRGWKYGVHSGLPTFSKAYWRRNKYGQFRDMLEQRPYAKYYQSPENAPSDPHFRQGTQPGVITVKFIGTGGRLTDPANTWSNNLSFECTSSFPYIEDTPTSRNAINVQTLNQSITTITQDPQGNITL